MNGWVPDGWWWFRTIYIADPSFEQCYKMKTCCRSRTPTERSSVQKSWKIKVSARVTEPTQEQRQADRHDRHTNFRIFKVSQVQMMRNRQKMPVVNIGFKSLLRKFTSDSKGCCQRTIHYCWITEAVAICAFQHFNSNVPYSAAFLKASLS